MRNLIVFVCSCFVVACAAKEASYSPNAGVNAGNGLGGYAAAKSPSAAANSAAPASAVPVGSQWLQLSTDDSTSMASPELYKAAQGGQLFPHEFVNYYDPPVDLFDQEPWVVTGEPAPGIRLGLEAVQDEQGAAGQTLQLLFEMRAKPVDPVARRNWNLVYCVDVSGSMADDNKIGFVRDALAKSLGHLIEGDHVTLITFDEQHHDVFIDLAWPRDEARMRSAFAALEPGSSTNMIDGMRRSYALAQAHFDPERLNRVLLFGDGDANVGDTDVATFSKLTRIQNQEGIYLSSVGVGYDFDWTKMDRLADAGKGASIFLPSSSEVNLMFGDYFPKLVEVAADEISIELTLPAGLSLADFTGEETSSDPNAPVQKIILAAGDDMTFIAKLAVEDDAALERPAALHVSMRPLGSGEAVSFDASVDHVSDLLRTPGNLYARTTLVQDFAQVAAGRKSADPKQVLAAARAYPAPDWGVLEMTRLLQQR